MGESVLTGNMKYLLFPTTTAAEVDPLDYRMHARRRDGCEATDPPDRCDEASELWTMYSRAICRGIAVKVCKIRF